MSSFLVALKRLREDRVPALGLGLLVFVTATVFGLAPRVLQQVGDQALQGVVANAGAISRNIALVDDGFIPAGPPTDPLVHFGEEGDTREALMPASVENLVESRSIVIESSRWRIEAPTPDPAFARFRIQPGAETRIHYVQGRAPTATTRTVALPKTDSPAPVGPDGSPQTRATVIEVALSSDAVHQINHGLGETLFVTLDPRDGLNAGRNRDVMAAMEIVGVFDVDQPLDSFWYDDTSVEKASIRSLGGDARAIDTTALLAPDEYQPALTVIAPEEPPFRTTWRLFVAPDRLSASRIDPLILDLRKLDTTFLQVTSRTLDGTALRSGLLLLVQAHAARWTSALAILTVVAIGPAAAAIAALGLVATIAARRRRPALSLVRERGATLGQIVRAVFLEGFVITVPALGLAVLAAALLLPAGSNRATIVAATIVTLLAIGLLIVTALPRSITALRAGRDDDPPRGPSRRRLVLDAVVIILAGFGAYLLRERGVRGTSSTGTLSGADPLIAAVPALAAIAVGLAAVRLVPLPLRLLGRVAARRRGLVPLLALRRAVQGGSTAAVLIVLLAAAAIGAFSSTALVHLYRAGEAASWHEVGAPYQISDPSGSLPAGLDPTKLPGVTSSARAAWTEVRIGFRSLRIQFLSVDAAAYEGMVRGTPADPALPPEMLANDPGPVVPILLSSSALSRLDDVKIGDEFELVVNGLSYQATAIAARDTFPTLPADALFGIASRQQLKAIHPEAQLIATTMFLDAPETAGQAIGDAVANIAPGAAVQGRAEVGRAFIDSPVTVAIVGGITLAAVVAALYAALAVTAALALAGDARAVEVAHLRALGLSPRGALGLVIVEHGPTVAIAFVAGIALGLGLFVLLEPGLGLDALVGSRIDVPLTADPRQLAIIFASVLAITIVGIGLAAWMQRRGTPVAALRRGFE
ncbi:MAG TPA: ABC transporter permease [Methylomirabilota bacterium]|nr:ABC transporter permease [Methylomirabilota bacterium]